MTIDNLQQFWGAKDGKTILRRSLLHLLVGLILGTIGPYDSDQVLSVMLRFAYWVGLVMFGSVICGPIARAFFPWFKKRNDSAKLAFVFFCAIMSVPIFVAVLVVDMTFAHVIFEEINQPLTLIEAFEYLMSIPFGALGLLLLYGQVFIISIMAFGAVLLLAGTTSTPTDTSARPPVGYKFLNRLPKNIGQNLLCLSMEDHYVRAHTDKGDALILMRMADAIAELEDYAGTQVHRSWWVAYSAIVKTGREKRRHFVHLTNGMDVPVSQTHIGKLQEQGYF